MGYVRKTRDAYFLCANYGYGNEELFECEDLRDAKEQKRTYNKNEPTVYHFILKKRVPVKNN